MRFRFVHAADLHLDAPCRGIGRVAPHVAEALRDASLQAWDALVELALREQAAFVVLAGDVYDGAQAGVRAQLRFLHGLQRLSRAGIPTFVVHGNHDPLEGWSAVREWPPGVTVFGAEAVQAVPVERDGRRLATVYGISYARREERRNLAALFRRQEAPGLHVGVLHATVGGQAGHEPYAPCGPDDLRAAGMDYWALGHVHARQVVLAGRPWAVYPGNLQGRSPAPGELGAKGALVVECDDEAGVLGEPRFVPLDRVRFAGLELDVTAARDLPSAVGELERELGALQEEHAGRGLVVRARLTGRPAWHADALRADADELVRALRERLAGYQPFVWLDALELRLAPPLDRERVRERGDFASALVAEAGALRDDPEALAALLGELDAELRAGGRGSLLPVGPAVDGGELLRRAEERCLALLLGGEES